MSCKHETRQETPFFEDGEITTSIYPEAITKVLNAHGGIDRWNSMNQLSFSIERNNGQETVVTDLKHRRSLITTPTYKLGYDSKNLWLKETDTVPYTGNAKFYNGLMFYFYAMPFVLGDSGINYETAEDLVFEGVHYPGILISYEDGVGVSSNDEYILYYDSKTGVMQWLAYTVTYGKESKNDEFHLIRYQTWQDINGLKLPKSIDWYNYDNYIPTEKRNTAVFTGVNLSKKVLDKSFFSPQPGSKIIQ